MIRRVKEWESVLQNTMFKGVHFDDGHFYSYCEIFDIYKSLYHSRYFLFDYDEDLEENVKLINSLVLSVFRINRYKYQTPERTETLVYNPIENYSMVEIGEDNNTTNNTVTNDLKNTTTSNNNVTSESESNTQLNNEENSIKNVTTFDNITDFKPTEKNDFNIDNKTNSNGKNTTTSNSNNIDIKTGAVTTNTTNTNTHNFKRTGNIGVTTTQEMLMSEREVANFSTLKVFFEDINEFLLLKIY